MERNVLISIKEVILRTSFSKTTIYRLVRGGHFPKPIKISARRVGWLLQELDEWLNVQTQRREGEKQ
jgi:prophage regulatory protein